MHSGPECTTRENAFMVGHNFVKVNFNGRINVSYKCCTHSRFARPKTHIRLSVFKIVQKLLNSLRSVAGLVIQATWRTEFEDGLRQGSPGGVLSDNPSVRTSSLVTPVL